MKTHVVIDMVYHPDEGNHAFVGTESECHEFVEGQGSFGFEVKPMTKEELRIHNPELVAKSGRLYYKVPLGMDIEVWDAMSIVERLNHLGLIVDRNNSDPL